jgi:hypothetical protein
MDQPYAPAVIAAVPGPAGGAAGLGGAGAVD